MSPWQETAGKPAGRKDAAALIGDAVGRILARDNGQRYDWRLGASGQLEYWENGHCAAEQRREGHWLLETEEAGLSAVEAAFRAMKDVLELRPVWHQVEDRVRAHVLVAVSLVEFELPDGKTKAGVCVNGDDGGQSSEARRVLRALGAQLEAPQPAEGAARTVH